MEEVEEEQDQGQRSLIMIGAWQKRWYALNQRWWEFNSVKTESKDEEEKGKIKNMGFDGLHDYLLRLKLPLFETFSLP